MGLTGIFKLAKLTIRAFKDIERTQPLTSGANGSNELEPGGSMPELMKRRGLYAGIILLDINTRKILGYCVSRTWTNL